MRVGEYLTLNEACKLLLPLDGPDTLRSMHAKGLLPFYKPGRRIYVKPEDVLSAIEKCRVLEKLPVSGSIRSAISGLSVTARSSSAQDALERIVGRPRNSLDATSPRNTRRRQAASEPERS